MITELETINKMLSASGLAPVADMNTQHPSYKKALLKLTDVSRSIQSQGYWFNASIQTLIPTGDGNLYVPQKALHCSALDTEDEAAGIVARGTRMYSTRDRTYNIGKTVRVELVELLPYNELPPAVAEYIAARAVHEFYLDQGGQEPKLSEYRGMRQVAEVAFKKATLKNQRNTQPTYTRHGFSNRYPWKQT